MSKAIWRATWLAGVLVGHLAACAAPASDDGRAALEIAIHRWVAAVNAQDAATLNATMTEDVELTDGTTTIAGREAAIRALRDGARRGQLTATTRDITITRDVARHTAALTRTQKTGDVQADGEAHENWRRVDGQWQLYQRRVTAAESGISLERPSTKEPVLDQPKN